MYRRTGISFLPRRIPDRELYALSTRWLLILPKPLPEPTTVPKNLTEPLKLRGQKREYISEDKLSNKILQKNLQHVSVSSQPLTKANLEEHN